jgi:glycosyltransferase involved in cell wall biosynthesis
LKDDPYTRGKCGFKLLQYMSCGVVPIASSVGFNKEIISHGVDGFLVTRESQWKEFASTLFNDRNLLEQMAQKARLKVVNSFDITQSSNKFLQIIDSI